ncbi:DUF389 domain-containing protein [Maribellus comscasis]|uniref:DUF389 domain-containing protein n=1 Tax=Maribellus comscasis TaxID=2681766 RepID=A0A6I6JJA8_9BACT|nr:DUF389 domain-containing protein [Maribellus comscasis]QGY42351.1 DUF389 domain-containing protein [Maribellus comscasis]
MKKKNELQYLVIAARRFLRSILSITDGTDIDSTIAGIKRDISFRGPTAWILIFSIFIASIGLNVNSTAVIIGAMLISPLMGPILGIGLSIGTNDFETLIRSLKNLGIAVSIALITSTLYFLVTPLNIEQSELLARTKPTILDVMVALFGGFAGIVAGSRKEKTNVIPGVAIATALMPPLCTAGYGLATFKMHYFLGAFYLFFINSVFISLATFLVVKYLKFPLVNYLNPLKAKRYQIIVTAFIIVTIIPSGIIFYNVIQETRFSIAAENFVNDKASFSGSELINKKITYSDTLSTIDLYYIGEEISEEKEMFLQDMLTTYGLNGKKTFAITKKTRVRVHQNKNNEADFEQRMTDMNNDLRLKILEDIYTKNEQIINDKELKIQLLEAEIMRLSIQDTIPFKQINSELKFHFDNIEKFAFANIRQLKVVNDTMRIDTIPTFLVNYKSEIRPQIADDENQKINEWLRIRFNNPKISVINY